MCCGSAASQSWNPRWSPPLRRAIGRHGDRGGQRVAKPARPAASGRPARRAAIALPRSARASAFLPHAVHGDEVLLRLKNVCLNQACRQLAVLLAAGLQDAVVIRLRAVHARRLRHHLVGVAGSVQAVLLDQPAQARVIRRGAQSQVETAYRVNPIRHGIRFVVGA
ncbi:hypothetical protein G6F68_016663 [Rhizopus microsporus]|nr:hypothetical protein G6F68_016663 [Rhizopus microsporus]